VPAADPVDTKANESRSIAQAGVPGAALASGGEVGAALGTTPVVALVGEAVGDDEAIGDDVARGVSEGDDEPPQAASIRHSAEQAMSNRIYQLTLERSAGSAPLLRRAVPLQRHLGRA
jgi:hypothetical protein